MKVTTYLEKSSDLDFYTDVAEVILQVRELSRFGKLSLSEAHSLATEALIRGHKVTLEWDILMTENVFQQVVKTIEQVDFKLFSQVRAQDPGAIMWLKENRPETKVTLLLETGNHNFLGIKTWCDALGKQLAKVALSIELPHERLKNYIEALQQEQIEVELLGLGRILLFYTPRSLLAPVVFDHEDDKQKVVHGDIIERLASSEESPHKGFPVVETKHGTFMFHIKEHWLLDNVNDLFSMKLNWLRVDLRFGKDPALMSKIMQAIKTGEASTLKAEYPADVMKGFFNVNKTDVLFGKLKNQKLQRVDQNYVGDVYEVIKEEAIIFMNRNPKLEIKPGMELVIINPDGKEIPMTIRKLKNSEGRDSETICYQQLAVVNYMGSVVARSQVYYKNSY